MLVAAHNVPVLVRDGAGVKTVPACLSVFRIGPDGKLEFSRPISVINSSVVAIYRGILGLRVGRQHGVTHY
jgi:hypothetical protein